MSCDQWIIRKVCCFSVVQSCRACPWGLRQRISHVPCENPVLTHSQQQWRRPQDTPPRVSAPVGSSLLCVIPNVLQLPSRPLIVRCDPHCRPRSRRASSVPTPCAELLFILSAYLCSRHLPERFKFYTDQDGRRNRRSVTNAQHHPPSVTI